MAFTDKIIPRDQIRGVLDRVRAEGKTVVQCHGCFDILHPGHIRYLVWAKEQGDVLLVSVSGDRVVAKGWNRPYVPEELRAENLAACEMVDYVTVDNGASAEEILAELKPDVYVKGSEFQHDFTGRIGRERKLVEGYGGKVAFSSGDVVYSSSYIIEHMRDKIDIAHDRIALFRRRHEVSTDRLKELIGSFASQRVLVIGDATVEEYVYGDALGMQSDAPVATLHPLETLRYPGGAALVAGCLHGIGAQTRCITVVGEDDDARWLGESLAECVAEPTLVADKSRPTPMRRRYIANNTALLEVATVKWHELSAELEQQVLARLEEELATADAVVVADLGLGAITEGIAARLSELAREGKTVVADVRSLAATGDIAKFQGVRLTMPDEREARIALHDSVTGPQRLGERLLRVTGNGSLILLLGGEGLLVFDQGMTVSGETADGPARLLAEHIPPLPTIVRDPHGTREAMLATCGAALAAGANIFEAALLANAAAAVAVGLSGPLPITAAELSQMAQ